MDMEGFRAASGLCFCCVCVLWMLPGSITSHTAAAAADWMCCCCLALDLENLLLALHDDRKYGLQLSRFNSAAAAEGAIKK